MTQDNEATGMPDWEKSDKNILRLFVVAFAVFFVMMILVMYYIEMDIFGIIGSIFGDLAFSFIVTGFLAFKYHHKRGIVPTKRILKYFAIISAFAAVLITAMILYFVSADIQNIAQFIAGAIFIFLGMLLAIFLVLFLFLIAGFGIFGVVAVFQRRYTARYLIKVRNLTPGAGEATGRKNRIEDSTLKWLFKVPKVLDSSTLSIDLAEPRKRFPWRTYRSALMWEIFFSAVLAIYVSLNPFLFDVSSFEQRFSLASSLSIIVPVFVIPWFIYRRLKARIKGPAADFRLFDGIVDRMVGTLVAFGTLIIFIRFALKDVDAIVLLTEFISFYFFFTIVTLVATFVYFNNFEDDLSISILHEYNTLRSQSKSMT